jgi:hypothetical protein
MAVDGENEMAAVTMKPERVHILEVDPDLGAALEGERLEHARERCTAELISLPKGRSWWPLDPSEAAEYLGLLVLRGALLYHLRLAGRDTVDLVGPGDLIRPWPAPDDYADLFTTSRWQPLEAADLAGLDRRFLKQTCDWPELLVALAERTARQARSLTLRLAISQNPLVGSRVQLMLWHLADRFGLVVRDGVLVPLPLSREVIARLVSVRRETVSRGLKELAKERLVVADPRGWRLCGPPPSELLALEHAVASADLELVA